MKKLLFLSLFIAPVTLVAQPVLTYQSHGLKAGEDNTMQQVQYVAPGESGTMQVWDYSNLSPLSEGRTETIAQDANGKTRVMSAGGGYFTYNCNESGNIYEAYESPDRLIRYDRPITKMRYPFTYGDAVFGSFSANCFYGADHSLGGNMAGNYSSEADAYGVLLLPNNVKLNNVLRVKTKESYVEEVCSNVHVELIKYLWYAPEYRYPVFVTWNITYTYENGQTSTVNESFYTTKSLESSVEPAPVTITVDPGIREEQVNTTTTPEVTYSVYPNPYNSYFHLTYTLEKETLVDIALFSSTGQYITHLVKSKRQDGIQHITYNPHSANLAGFYFLRMTFDDKVYVQSLIKE